MTNPQPHWKIFKFQIGSGHGKMTDPTTLTKNFKFQILGYGKMTGHGNFRFGLDMKMPSPTLTETSKFQILPRYGKMTDPPPSPKILNFRFCLDMERWLTPQPSPKILNYQIHGLDMRKMTDPQPSPNNLNFRFWPGHGKMINPTPSLKIIKFQPLAWTCRKMTNPPTFTETM